MTWAIVPATPGAARYLAPRLMPADAAECWAMAHVRPLEALRLSMRYSMEAWTWLVDDIPACLFGLSSEAILGDKAAPWMLSTPAVKRHAFAFLRNYRGQIDRWLAMFPVLETYVDARHGVCLRWLAWTGFHVDEPIPLGAEGLPFHRVSLARA